MTITRMSVNDALAFPLFTTSTSVPEDSATKTLAIVDTASVTKGAANESGQLISYAVDAGYNTSLFQTQPTVSSIGYLTFRPATNVSGVVVLNIRAVDNGGTDCGGLDRSLPQPFTISITPSNDAPVLAAITNVTVSEGLDSTPDVLVPLSLGDIETSLGDMNLGIVLSNQSGGIVNSVAAEFVAGAWRLRIPVVAEASGQVNIHVKATDGGENPSPARSVSRSFLFKVTAVNDAPTFLMDSNTVSSAKNATVSLSGFSEFHPNANLYPDPTEATQTDTYTVTVSAADKAKFSVQPTINAAGTLSYKFAASATGSVLATVKVTDNGGTLGGGLNVSANQTLTFTVTP